MMCDAKQRCDQDLRPGAGGSRSAVRPSDEELAPQRANVWSPHWFGQEGDAREAHQLSIHQLLTFLTRHAAFF